MGRRTGGYERMSWNVHDKNSIGGQRTLALSDGISIIRISRTSATHPVGLCMIHPDTRLGHVNDSIGDGIFATSRIPIGTIVYVIDPLDIRLTRVDFEQLESPVLEMADKYSYIDQNGDRILSWDLAKYVNHSCDPNTISSGYGFEIALRDIENGEQLTDDYGLFNLEWTIDCHCGSDRCRGMIRGYDLDRYADMWDTRVREALGYVRSVHQPLWEIMYRETRDAVDRYLDGKEPYRSVRALRWTGLKSVATGRRARRRS